MDELVENPAAARQMESRSQEVQTEGASRQLHEKGKATDADSITEEAMHLDL
jgi:hypothetical protein